MSRLKLSSQSALSAVEHEHYERCGFVVPEIRLRQQTLEGIRDSYRRLAVNYPDIGLDFVPSPHVPDFVPGFTDCQDWLDYAAIPEVLDAVEAVIGPDFLMWGSAVFGKPAISGKATPMHQDGEYWPLRPLASVTVWIALDNAGSDNGCLRVVPGSHRAKRLYAHRRDDSPELTLNQVVSDESANVEAAVDVCLEAGQFSIHDVHLIHGSAPNTSPRNRAALTYRYMPTTSHFDHDWAAEMTRTMGTTDMSDRTLYLMRGIDRCGRNDFSKGRATRLSFSSQSLT